MPARTTSSGRIAVALVVLVAALGAAACGRTPQTGGGDAPSPGATPSTPAPARSAPLPSPAVTPPLTGPGTPRPSALLEDIGLASFGAPTTIDNPWLPLTAGTRWVWEGEANTDEGRFSRRVVLIVTDLTKVVDGVRTVVAYERDFSDGQLSEAELVFFAQDDVGRVWHLGQYPEEYEGGEFVDAPAWIAGQRDAAAGIFMQAEARRDDPSYSQGWGPEVGWTDRARVFETGARTCVPLRCYDDVLVIDEYSLDEPDARQIKYYARGVGNVRVGWAGTLEQEREVLELVDFGPLEDEALAEARDEALALERHAYEVSPDVYGTTVPAERRP